MAKIDLKIVMLGHVLTELKSKSRTVTKHFFTAGRVWLIHAGKLSTRLVLALA